MPEQGHVIHQAYHRNGVGGRGFVVSLVHWDSAGDENEFPVNPFVAISFGVSDRGEFIEQTAALSIPLLLEGSIDFARGNSWRGSDYLGPLVADAWRERCLARDIAPYDPFE